MVRHVLDPRFRARVARAIPPVTVVCCGQAMKSQETSAAAVQRVFEAGDPVIVGLLQAVTVGVGIFVDALADNFEQPVYLPVAARTPGVWPADSEFFGGEVGAVLGFDIGRRLRRRFVAGGQTEDQKGGGDIPACAHIPQV